MASALPTKKAGIFLHALYASALFLGSTAYGQDTSLTLPSTTASEPEAKTFSLTVRLLERGTKTPLTDVPAFLLPKGERAISNALGNVTWPSVPSGDYSVVVNLSGYEKATLDVKNLSQDTRRTLYIRKLSFSGAFETRVIDERLKRDPAQRSITTDTFLTQAGGGQDPIRAVQNLSGVSRTAGFSAQVVIQGSAPEQTAYLLDGHEVPFIFHFGGLNTVLFPEAVGAVDFLSAGYGPEYGRALAGLVGVRTRNPRMDRWRGIGYVDIINAGALVEGPIAPKHGLMLSARQSYIGEVLKVISEASDDFALTSAPRYTDVTGVYTYTPNSRHLFKATGVASLDGVEFVVKNTDDPFLRGNLEADTRFFRLIPQYTFSSEGRLQAQASMGLGWTKLRVDINDQYLGIATWSLTPRAELRIAASPSWTHYVGMDHKITLTQADVLLPDDYAGGGVFNPLAAGETRGVNTFTPFFNLGFYHRLEWQGFNKRLTLSPAYRIDYFSETDGLFIDPRMSARFEVTPSLSFRASTGLYHQAPEGRQINAVSGNPDLDTPGAFHASAAVEKDFSAWGAQGLKVSTGPFYRYSYDLATESTQLTLRDGALVPQNYASLGTARAVGLETTLRFERPRYGVTLAHTWLESRLKEPGLGSYPNPFDQTHNLNLLGRYSLSDRWLFSTRVRYVTGNPFTPVVGSTYDADNNVFIPVRGAFYSDRASPFFQWDVRVDRRFIFKTWILSLYLDVQNVTNRANAEGLVYSFDYRESDTQSGLPVIPSFGVKGEF